MGVIDYGLRRRILALEQAVGEGGGGGDETSFQMLESFVPPANDAGSFELWDEGPSIAIPAGTAVFWAINRECIQDDETGDGIAVPYLTFMPDDPDALDASILGDVAAQNFTDSGDPTDLVSFQCPAVSIGSWRSGSVVYGQIVRGFDLHMGIAWYTPANVSPSHWRNVALSAIGL